eukprot:CAMPEP_0170103228 /NCGR_PEP_ID=MMETSP0020_2-20130122/3360_1 /TAXON_ID=98059 /ORGANISM="Dinobryon sp., Strain UTEXLB2267" /LENGTH=165 /DNA_ID=CAMNT_0010326737 /DNA_START=523 /DNA_END=1019 /DNA_ORIENTATION=+
MGLCTSYAAVETHPAVPAEAQDHLLQLVFEDEEARVVGDGLYVPQQQLIRNEVVSVAHGLEPLELAALGGALLGGQTQGDAPQPTAKTGRTAFSKVDPCVEHVAAGNECLSFFVSQHRIPGAVHLAGKFVQAQLTHMARQLTEALDRLLEVHRIEVQLQQAEVPI